ncbi:MAG: SBBP repeat-containing protein, partial [Candidatus Paceibacterota bacterium]
MKNRKIFKYKLLGILLLTTFLIPLFSFADDVTYSWAKGMGGTGADYAQDVFVDTSGNVYTTGYFAGTADFDPGAGTSNLTSAGSDDIFVSKLDTSGNFVWVKQFGGTSSDRANSISVDSSGNVYTTGYFAGTADFDPGAGTSNLTSAGNADIFVSKLDTSGNFVWVKQLGGTNTDNANSISVDSSGNVYTTGYFADTADFDPGAGTSNLTSAGAQDIFVSKLDTSGNFVLVKQFGGTGGDYAQDVFVDSSGNVYTTGYFADTADFDPGAGTSNLTSASVGVFDIFVSKLDTSGNFVWVKQFGGTGEDRANSISVDSSGNVYTTGYFRETVDFDPGAGTSNLTFAGADDIFVSKLDTSGNFVWVKQLGGTGNERANSISVDTSGNVYTTGYFYATADFDPGAGTSNLTPVGNADIFVSKLDTSGNFVWGKQLGGTDLDTANSIYVDSSGNVYTTGRFNGTADFDPGAGTSNLTSAGGNDIFVSKLVFVSDSTAPTVSTLSPLDNATGVTTTANLVITFDEAVDPEAGADNNIVIYKGSDDSVIETIDAQDAKVTGGGTTTITINPAATLTEQTAYYIQIGADAFDDAASNSYAGIADTTSWSFTTGDFTNPTVSTLS